MPESQEADEKSITIDDKNYLIESLSDEAKKQIISMRVADQEIMALNHKLAIAQTARNAYANALRECLPEDE